MAAKRPRDQGDDDREKIRATPSFSNVVREATSVTAMRKLFSIKLEPMLRRLVREELKEQGVSEIAKSLRSSHGVQVVPTEPATLRLAFSSRLSHPIFTTSKISCEDGRPLQLLIEDASTAGRSCHPPPNLPSPVRVEIVAVDGEFNPDGHDDWTSEEFERSIVRKREGRRPLLAGDHLTVTVRGGGATTVGVDVAFTDNSSWVKCRRFRLGARVVAGSCGGARIREAVSEAFVVRDHRGESCKKHHPPSLTDEVWRLEKIGKNGVFHKRLAAASVRTVQDFLKLAAVDARSLRKILGMSDKMWDVAITHARDFVPDDNRRYLYSGSNSPYTLVLDSTCRVSEILFGGLSFAPETVVGPQKHIIEKMVREAYSQWNELEVVDAVPVAANDAALVQGGTESFPAADLLSQEVVMAPGYGYHMSTGPAPDVGVPTGTSVWLDTPELLPAGAYSGDPPVFFS